MSITMPTHANTFLTPAEMGPCPRLVQYSVARPTHTALCYVSNAGTYHRYVYFNHFEKKPSRKPTGSTMTEVDCHASFIQKDYYDYYVRYVKPWQVPEFHQQHYFTHHNMERPFVVFVSKPLHTVTVYCIPNAPHERVPEEVDQEDASHMLLYYTHLVCRLTVADVWIGKSPMNAMTDYGDGSGPYGGYGPALDGNSMLIHNKSGPLRYTFIGPEVYSFQASAPIQSFLSPVDDIDVPYPFARDVQGRYYFFLDRMTLESVPEEWQFDAYDYFYKQTFITGTGNPHVGEYGGFTAFYIGDVRYNLTYQTDAASNYKWITTKKTRTGADHTVKLSVEHKNGHRVVLSEADYVALMARFGQERGFGSFQKVRVHQKRL